ncbi:hypothetical protein A0J61_00015 [Choanephora cucurbitarum]|uniref:Uncharacterized protein n=1 Tax=Choanephora cucurbitarum TaxID=101091 RepID=A0A1C7NT43_9FUNG|nr:hypothetical protein A0J61_00015 [Choanephora cucurbitarum]
MNKTLALDLCYMKEEVFKIRRLLRKVAFDLLLSGRVELLLNLRRKSPTLVIGQESILGAEHEEVSSPEEIRMADVENCMPRPENAINMKKSTKCINRINMINVLMTMADQSPGITQAMIRQSRRVFPNMENTGYPELSFSK